MAQLIKTFVDGSTLEYDKGKFDNWCVYLTRPGTERYAPRDFQYFDRIQQLSAIYGANTIYNDFVKVYDETTKVISQKTLDLIDSITSYYDEDDGLELAIDLTIMYMGMIAEENKAFTKLGKRVKRLGVYQVLMEGMSYKEAADYSRGMGWREIDRLCRERGF